MPTEKFTNLCEYKKRTILNAIRDELLENSYGEVKISRVIKRAHISRASFYLYFDGKEDMLQAMLRQMQEDTGRHFEEALKTQNGSFFGGMKLLAAWLLEEDEGIRYGKVYRIVMTEKKCWTIFQQTERELFQSGRKDEWCGRCYELMDPSQYPNLRKEQLQNALEMGCLTILRAAILKLEDRVEPSLLMQVLEKQLQILDNGIRG